MDKALFEELLQSVGEMDLITRGEAAPARVTSFPDPDVQAIREQSGLTQSRFAQAIGVSRRTLENWEQKRRQPTGPAKALLRLVEAAPQTALRGLLLTNRLPAVQQDFHLRSAAAVLELWLFTGPGTAPRPWPEISS